MHLMGIGSFLAVGLVSFSPLIDPWLLLSSELHRYRATAFFLFVDQHENLKGVCLFFLLKFNVLVIFPV